LQVRNEACFVRSAPRWTRSREKSGASFAPRDSSFQPNRETDGLAPGPAPGCHIGHTVSAPRGGEDSVPSAFGIHEKRRSERRNVASHSSRTSRPPISQPSSRFLGTLFPPKSCRAGNATSGDPPWRV